MRFPARSFLSFVFLILFASALIAQTQQPTPAPQPTDPQAAALLARSAAALSGTAPLSDITLTGTARRIAGSDDESGQGILKALASGAGRTDLSLPSGTHSEVQNGSSASPSGTWSGPDGVAHAIAFHNLLAAPAWFFRTFVISQKLATSGYVATYVGHETHNAQAVEHVSLSQPLAGSTDTAALFQHLSQIEIYLDSTTFLPAAISFNVHPDNNASLDIPSEIRYSDYRSVGAGVGAGFSPSSSSAPQIPFHIQKYLNNTLVLDFQAQTVTLNSGLSASGFTVQ